MAYQGREYTDVRRLSIASKVMGGYRRFLDGYTTQIVLLEEA